MAVKIIDRQDRGAGVAAAPLFSGRFFMFDGGNGMLSRRREPRSKMTTAAVVRF